MWPMGTELKAWATILSRYKKEEEKRERERERERERDLVTLDLLGGGPIGVGSGDLDLEIRVCPPGLENRNDLVVSDKMQPQKPSPAPARRQLQDLNLPPAPEDDGDAPPLEDSASPDLNIVAPAASGYHSVKCTLETVKTALERVEHESRDKAGEEGRVDDGSPWSSTTSAAVKSSTKRRWAEEGGGSEDGAVDGSDSSGGSLMAAGCPKCLLYVLAAKRDPRCPRCGSHVPVPFLYKKSKFHI